MTDKETKLEELSTASTNDDSPSNEKLSQESFSQLKEERAKQQDLLKESEKQDDKDAKIEKLSNYVVRMKKALEQQNTNVQLKVLNIS
jgi:hypothetical protein